MTINQTENNDNLELLKVGDLLSENNDRKFFIPAYQRGYRWNAEQSTLLVDDILDFNTDTKGDSEAFYCLQPLVTSQANHPRFNGYIEVIDGQQRLTTILLLLQALHVLIQKKSRHDADKTATLYPLRYEIQYETRDSSEIWLNKIMHITSLEDEEAQNLINENCDYSHLVESYVALYQRLDLENYDRLKDLRDVIVEKVKFIPYTPQITKTVSNNDIFDDINAGKIELNNAELVKAILLQDTNLKSQQGGSTNSLIQIMAAGGLSINNSDLIKLLLSQASSGSQDSESHRIDTIAIQWDKVEKRLQDREFWGFIYSSRFPIYDTHIEYILDLLYHKTPEDHDEENYTFNKVYQEYRNAEDKLKFAEETWDKINKVFETLVEWYENRPLYHRIGYLLEFDKNEDILTLRDNLVGMEKDAQIEALNKKIEESLKNVEGKHLFHKDKRLSQILFLYNILAEDRRIGSTARFSFADYKNVMKENAGWDQEHVASRTDTRPELTGIKEFAEDLIEYFTGEKTTKASDKAKLTLGEKELEFVERLENGANKDTDFGEENLRQLFTDILDYFNTFRDGFSENAETLDGNWKSEKDFIWNFVLLNAKTNRSYGNSLFPVKRRRILKDEYEVYTPVGTRNVFEKAYSRKFDNMMSWTRDDAKAYWGELTEVLNPYVRLEFPFKNF